jgi:hypothetical protein
MAAGEHVPPSVEDRLKKALQFIAHYMPPNGSAPVIGDADDGRLLVLSPESVRNINDHSYLVSAGAVAFADTDLAAVAGVCHKESQVLLGHSARREFDELTVSNPHCSRAVDVHSRAFPQGGLFVLRHQDLHMTIRAGDVGQEGNGGHAHNDCLSVTLSALGHPWLVDSGLACYTSDYDARNRSRSTSAHNTLQIDDAEINPFERNEVFRLADQAHVSVRNWDSSATNDLFVGEHTGYARLEPGVVHRRTVNFAKRDRSWTVADEVLGTGRHRVRFALHCLADIVSLERISDARWTGLLSRSGCGKINVDIDVSAPQVSWLSGSVISEPIYVSYGHSVPGHVLALEFEAVTPISVNWRLRVVTEETILGAAGP